MSHYRKPLLISHRANCGGAPENSFLGVKACVELGIDGIEIDVQRTRDGQLLLMHDLKVDRTTTGSGKLRELEYEEIADLRLLSDRFPGERVPLLEEVLAFMANFNMKLLLELKSPGKYPGIGNDLVRLLRKYEMEDRVEVLCFDRGFLKELKLAYPFVLTCVLSSLPFNFYSGGVFDSLGIYYRSLLIRNGLGFSLPPGPIYAGTPATEKAFRKLFALKIEGIITDDPELLFKVLDPEQEL